MNVIVEVEPLQLTWLTLKRGRAKSCTLHNIVSVRRPLCNQTKQWTLVRNLCNVTLIYDLSVTAPCSCSKYSLARKHIYWPTTVVYIPTNNFPIMSRLNLVTNKQCCPWRESETCRWPGYTAIYLQSLHTRLDTGGTHLTERDTRMFNCVSVSTHFSQVMSPKCRSNQSLEFGHCYVSYNK